MKKWLGTAVALLTLVSAATLRAEVLTVVSPEGPLPSVVTTAEKTDQDAATDFCSYFSRVSGRTIAPAATPADNGVIIHIGRDVFVREHAPEIESLFADGYIVKVLTVAGRNHIILAGKIDPSSQWAVEQFLKDYGGVHWLFPDPVYGEIVPSRPTITIDSALSKTYQPDYLSRGNLGMYYFNPARTQLRLRSNGYPYGSHAIQFIFNNGSSSGEVFAQHPEWFAFFNGKRQWWAYGNGWQICTTNPETVQHAVKYVLDYFAKNPDSPVCSVGHNDGQGWCECPVCQNFRNSVTPAYTTSEMWWSWVNQVAREVAKTYPDKWVESMAYESSSLPPRFPLEKNVTVTKTIVYSNSSGIFAELKLAEDWAKVCKSVNLYSYMWGASFMGFRHYPAAARDFLKWGHDKLGSLAHVTECYGDWTFDGPKYHYIMALQWDVNANLDEIMQDFCEQSYGLAAASMRKFWDRLEEVYERRGPTPYGEINPRFLFYQWPSWRDDFYVQPNDEFREYTLTDIRFLDDRIKEALSLAKDKDAGVVFRVERMSEAWKYYRTALVSKLKFYDNPPATNVSSESEQEKAFAAAKEIADLRLERKTLLGKMRAYPQVNPRIYKENYWGNLAALTIFNNEVTLLDELCSAVTGYLEKTGGKETARKFWKDLKPEDSLSESAQTQLYLLGQSKTINLLQNNGFESGDTKGWEIDGGQVSISKEGVHQGNYALKLAGGGTPTLSQKVPVSSQERYRLTAWIKYLAAPVYADSVPAESRIEFYAGSNQILDEPTRNILRTTSPSAGWMRLCSTVTIPPGVDTVLIKLRGTYNCTALLDEVTFEKIKANPEGNSGALADTFGGKSLDQEKWFQTTGSRGRIPPRIADGWLIFEDAAVYSITAYAKFNDLLKYTGEKQYRLRLHAAKLSDDTKPTAFSWGIKTGTGGISISDSGMFWTYRFRSPEQPNAQLLCYAYQDSKYMPSGGGWYDINRLNNANEIWFTLYFDPEYVTVYASANGYDEKESSLVARYKHGINNIAANGDVYLKMDGGSYKLNEITLTRP